MSVKSRLLVFMLVCLFSVALSAWYSFGHKDEIASLLWHRKNITNYHPLTDKNLRYKQNQEHISNDLALFEVLSAIGILSVMVATVVSLWYWCKQKVGTCFSCRTIFQLVIGFYVLSMFFFWSPFCYLFYLVIVEDW